MIFDLHFIHLVVHDSLDESLHPKLKITGSKQNVPPNVFMNAGVLLKKCLNIFTINPALLVASSIDVRDIVIPQEGSEVLRVPDVFNIFTTLQIYVSDLYLLSPHDRVKKMWKGPTFSSIALSSILLTLQYLN